MWQVETFPNFATIDNKSYYDFVYTDEYIVSCTNIEINFYLIVGGIAIFVIVVGVVIFAVCTTMKYRNMYTKLLDERAIGGAKEMKEQESIYLNANFGRTKS